MLRLSKKTDYALLALRHLALAGSAGQTVPARELSETYDLPPELLAKVLQRLVRGGLLVSQQGIRGGYELAKPADQITVADVVTVVDGATKITACTDEGHDCDQFSKCAIRDPLWKLKDRIVSALAATTVAELATPVPASTHAPDVFPVTLHR